MNKNTLKTGVDSFDWEAQEKARKKSLENMINRIKVPQSDSRPLEKSKKRTSDSPKPSPSPKLKKLGEPLCETRSTYAAYSPTGKTDRKRCVTVLSKENVEMLNAVSRFRNIPFVQAMNNVLDECRVSEKMLDHKHNIVYSYQPGRSTEGRVRANRPLSVQNYDHLMRIAQTRGGLPFVRIFNDILDEYRSLFSERP